MVSHATVEEVKKDVDAYLNSLIEFIVDKHNQQNKLRQKVRLPIKKVINHENSYLKEFGRTYILGKNFEYGEIGAVNRKTILSKEVL